MNNFLNNSKNIICTVFFFLFVYNLQAQKELGNEVPEVKVIATVTKKKVLLRWGVTTPIAWKHANKNGFIIERKTIVINGEIVKSPNVIQLNDTPIKPKPMLEWKEFTEKNDNAAIAAQALYGEQFDVEMNEGNGLMSILNQAQAIEQRFSFALYAADQDFEVAKFSGLAYEDTTVKENEKYLYTIKVVNVTEKKPIKKGGVLIATSDYKPLPQPQEFAGVFKDKTVLLSWNFLLLKKYYNNYIIERSSDNGNTFNELTNTPITNLGDSKKSPSARMMYVDSLFQNDKSYSYRIKGISPFGEKGPYSNIVSGKGVTPLKHNPFLTKVDYLDNEDVLLSWEFPEEGMPTLQHFKLLRANKVKGNYTVVNPEINKNERSIRLTNVKPINYYKIVAIGNDKGERTSFPKMVQPDDNTPPAIPTMLTGTIDTLGVVKLNWKLNIEEDFLGYRVFKANLEKDEFIQITFKPTPNNSIIDTVNIKTLNKNIYYKVQSFDKRYNPSDFSEVLKLDRPDIVPPTQPVFTSFKSEKDKVNLNWIASTSSDAKSTAVYRKEKGVQSTWELLVIKPIGDNSFVDENVLFGKVYLYTILTIDESGLESEPITPLKISVADDNIKPSINRFTGTVDREIKKIKLNWVYKSKKVEEYVLYKGAEEVSPTMYKIIKASKKSYTDDALIINTKYTYLLQAIFESGAKSPLKKIELNY